MPEVLMGDMKNRMEKSLQSFHDEIATVRTGIASTSLVDNIMVDCYGAAMPMSQVATVSTPEARTITIQPWDQGLVGEIEKSILASELGLTPNNDGKTVRINVPLLSEERRKDLIKIVRKMVEDARVAIRSVRRDGNDKVKKLFKDKKITEDDQRYLEQKIQNQTDGFIKKIDEALEKKEKDLATI